MMDLECYDLIVLYGKTGTGKTELLKGIANAGHQAIILQDLARHKGSAFGGLNDEIQPDQKSFEELIIKSFDSLDNKKPVWTEFESAYLGKLQVPAELQHKLMNSDMVLVRRNRSERINRIVREYSVHGKDKLLAGSKKLKKKLSAKAYRNMRKAIHEGDYERAVSFMLGYYDRIYRSLRKTNHCRIIWELDLSGSSLESNIKDLLACKKTL